MNIANAFNNFWEHLTITPEKGNTDFIGMNFSEDCTDVVFKVYYATKTVPSYREHPLVRFLYSVDMLRDFEAVSDTISKDYLRVDTSLKNRWDENMERLFAYLKERTDLFQESRDDLRCLSGIRITDREDYTYGSLYHLGSTERNDEIESLKWYFLTRWCEDPERPWIRPEYRDEEYLEFLRKYGPEPYGRITETAGTILHSFGSHLWMTGLDIKSGWKKYKIYMKGGVLDYGVLTNVLPDAVKIRIPELRAWQELHTELEYNGMAICIDSENRTSVNLYYGFR